MDVSEEGRNEASSLHFAFVELDILDIRFRLNKSACRPNTPATTYLACK